MNVTEAINTKCGMIKGLCFDNHIEYRGIRYATSNRWEYPVAVASWDGTYEATAFGDCSYQRRSFEDDAVCNPFYHKEFRENLSFTYSEDSLFLNIWSPKEAKDCPVFIYIHGGSFTGGSSNEGHIDGTVSAENGVIFVAFNYRLGPFGFCSHPELTDENGICGNYGLFDQYTAIKWVRDNIQSFGGNPNQITIMGQSAGAMSVDIHSSCPLETGWFQGAIMSSGAALQRRLLRPMKPQKTVKFWNQVICNAKVSSMEELKLVDPKTLYYAWFDACKQIKMSIAYTMPVYDGKLLIPEHFKRNHLADMPYLVGMTITDMMPIALYKLNRSWLSIANKHNNSKSYGYILTRELPGDNKGAWHSSDLLYFFSTLSHNWRPFEEIDYSISNQMSNAMIAFAKTANPNCEGVPAWNSDATMPMTFCENTQQMKWDTKKLKNNTFKKGDKE